jgi:putative peptidoglycan lipid II flippase
VTRAAERASTAPRVLRSSAPVAIGTALSRITGLARLAAMAYALGFTRLTDTYNLANTTPNIVYELLLGGVLSATLVPVFVEHRDRGDDDATSAVVTMAGVLLVALTVVGVLAAPAIVRIYTLRLEGADAAAQQEVATGLLRLFMPQMVFYGVTALATALLNAHRRFAAPAFTPVLNNVLVTAVFLAIPWLAGGKPTLAGARHDTGLLLLLGVGTTAGIAAMAIPLVPALRRAGIRLRPVFSWRHPAVRKVVALSGWTAGYVAANQVALWLVLVLANGIAGGVSAYTGAYMFFQLPHGLVAVSLMTTLSPELAAAAARRDLAEFRRHFSLGLRLMTLVILPAAAGYVVLARPAVVLLLQRGNFEPAAARLTAGTLVAFAVGLLPFSLYLFALRGFYSFHDTRTPFFINLFENALNVVLALAFQPWLGVQGLALSFSIAYAVAAVVALRSLGRRTEGVIDPRLIAALTRITLAAGVMTAAVAVAVHLFPARTPPVVTVTAGVAVGVTVYAAALAALRVREVAELLDRRRLRR